MEARTFTVRKERDVPEHMMLEGFRWSIGLVSRLLIRTITEGSTAVMQAINQDDARRLRRALREAPRAERSSWQLRVRVGSQSISPLHWALRSGAHTVARTMIQDVLTIRADRDRYYYGVDDLFRLQADVVEHILREAPILAETLLDGLIWRSHKTQDGLRPVIYYLEHLVQDMDESQMLSRALVSFVKFKHPRTIMHPILTFVLDLLWENLAMRSFFFDRLLTVISFIVYLLATCFLNQRALIEKPPTKYCLVAARTLVYGMGFGRLLYWHTLQAYRSLVNKDLKKLFCLSVPRYLLHGAEMCSFALMINMIVMLMVEPLVHCLGSTEDMIGFTCEAWTDGMSLTYAVCLVAGIFLYSILVLEIGNISIELSEYRVLCLHAFKQVMLCIAVVSITIFTFSFAITGMILTREATNLSGEEWTDLGRVITTLVQLTVGLMDLGELHSVAEESPFLLIVVSLFMVVVYSFFFNLLVSQFCGVYSSLAADIKGHARLARGETILETLKTIEWKRWKTFVTSLALDRRVDFEEGDIGLAGGIKAFEAALEHPVSKDQIVRFGGQTDPSLPWPEHSCGEENSTEKMIQRTIQKSLQKMLGKKAVGSIDDTSSSHPSSSHRSDIRNSFSFEAEDLSGDVAMSGTIVQIVEKTKAAKRILRALPISDPMHESEETRLRRDQEARDRMAAHMKAVEEAEASGSTGDRGAWKWKIRQRIWDYMEENDIAANPRPVHHRIPNFVQAELTAKQVVKLPEFQNAKWVKVNPDRPQAEVRATVLRSGKMLLVPQPRLRTGFFSVLDPQKIPLEKYGYACTQAGVVEFGQPIDLDADLKVDMVIIGSVAVNPANGARLGKGEGFAELEYGMLRLMGAVDDDTPVVSCIHDCQLVDDIPAEKLLCHDVPVDIICTPTQTIRVPRILPKPKGIYWDKLSPQKLGSILILQKLKAKLERETGQALPSGPDEILPPTAKRDKGKGKSRDKGKGQSGKGKGKGSGKSKSKEGDQGVEGNQGNRFGGKGSETGPREVRRRWQPKQ
eukprot:symbB.v1.2.030101.t1/scaffold3351.1/size58635/3